jgi:hypothetical protein
MCAVAFLAVIPDGADDFCCRGGVSAFGSFAINAI